MYVKCQRLVNPNCSLRQLPILANSKNKTWSFVCWRLVLLSTLAPSLLYIIKHSGYVSLIRGKLTWRPWIIILSFTVIYSNAIEKAWLYEKLGHFRSIRYFCWHQQNWSVILKNYYWCLLNVKYSKFHCPYAYNAEIMGKAFLTLLLQRKYATPR